MNRPENSIQLRYVARTVYDAAMRENWQFSLLSFS